MKNKLTILLLAGNTSRARAYAQILSNKSDDIIVKGLFLGLDLKEYTVPPLNSSTEEYFRHQNLAIPDFSKSLKDTFIENDWAYKSLVTTDVNSEIVLEEINKEHADIIVFAGYGGQILKAQHFTSDKKYLHMHPGELPIERGSTTIYYSILNKRHCSVTAFFMTEKIDAGENILCSTYQIPHKGVDIDNWYDNVVRADCLYNAIQSIIKKDKTFIKSTLKSEEYYVIHPVLKHVALLSLKN